MPLAIHGQVVAGVVLLLKDFLHSCNTLIQVLLLVRKMLMHI